MKNFLIFASAVLIMAFTSDKKYIVLHGEKYYHCETKQKIDTLESPGGVTIIKQTIEYYDHFKCK